MVISDEIINFDRYPNSLNLLGMLNPDGKGYGQFIYVMPNVDLLPTTSLIFYFKQSGRYDVQLIDEHGHGDLLTVQVVDADPPPTTEGKTALWTEQGVRYIDDEEEGVSYKSLVGNDDGRQEKMILRNTDTSSTVKGATLKIIFTEKQYIGSASSSRQDLPGSFEEIMRTKPKVMGQKESSFIQGSATVLDMFDYHELEPFKPKSDKIYTAAYQMGPGSNDDFMPTLDFEVTDKAAEFYMQLSCFDAEDDLFATLLSLPNDDPPERVARSDLGKYANSIGPVMLTKGWYRLVIHPDLEGDDQNESRTEVFRFGLDVLLETSSPNKDTAEGFKAIV